MSERFDFDLSEIGDFDDIKLDDAAAYQDQTGPAPIAPGNYAFAVVEAGRKRTQEDEPIDDNGYPQVVLNKLVVIEPEDVKGYEIYPFQAFSLRPIQGGKRRGAVPAVDLLRALDDNLTFTSGKEVLALLAEKFEAGAQFRAATNWLAKDAEFIRSFIDENGGDLDDVDEEERRKMFKQAIIRGQKRFPKVNGFYVPEIVGPSGDTLQARVTLTRLYPASKTVRRMGANKRS